MSKLLFSVIIITSVATAKQQVVQISVHTSSGRIVSLDGILREVGLAGALHPKLSNRQIFQRESNEVLPLAEILPQVY